MIRFGARAASVLLLLFSFALAAEQPNSRSGWTPEPGYQPVLPEVMPCAGAACPAGAIYQFFTNEADFLAAIEGGFYFEDFASIPVGGAGLSLSFSGNGFDYEVTAFGPGTNELFNDPGLLSLNSAADTMRITFTGDPVFAVGGNLYATDINFAATGAGIVLTLEDGSTETLASTSAATFAGFVSTSAIVFMDFDAPDVPSNNWPAINELYVGIAGSTAYTVGGTLSGLAAGNSVVLQNNAGDDLALTDVGAFVFGTAVDDGEAYAVTVLTQPSGPNQVCTVANGSGTITGEDVTDVEVSCVTESYSVGGDVLGLAAGNSVVLQNNGGDDLTVNANGSFTFVTEIDDGQAYAVTVLTEPMDQSCQLANAAGTIVGADINDVVVDCTSFDVELSTIVLDLGSVEIDGSSQGMVTLSNTGTGSVEILSYTGPDAPFALNGGSCPSPSFVLNPSESCTIEIQFSPVEAGDFQSTLLIANDAITEPLSLTVRGTGTAPAPPALAVPVMSNPGLVILTLLMLLLGLGVMRRFAV